MEKSAWWICYSRNHKIRNTAIIWSPLLLLCYSHVLLHIFLWLYATLYNNSIVFTNGIERSSSSSGSNHIFFCWLLSFALSSFLSPCVCVSEWVCVSRHFPFSMNRRKKPVCAWSSNSNTVHHRKKRTRFREKNKRKISEKPNWRKSPTKSDAHVRFMRMILNIYVYNKFFVFVFFFSLFIFVFVFGIRCSVPSQCVWLHFISFPVSESVSILYSQPSIRFVSV